MLKRPRSRSSAPTSGPTSAQSAGTRSSSGAPSTAAGSPSTETPSPSPAIAITSSASTPDTTATDTPPAPALDSAKADSEQKPADTVQLSQTPESDNREVAILERLAQNTPYREISREFGISIGALSAIAQRQRELETGAMAALMRARVPQMLDLWVESAETGAKTGKHAPMRDWLLHAKAIEAVNTDTQTGAKVAIIIGMPGSPASHNAVQVLDTQGVSVSEQGE